MIKQGDKAPDFTLPDKDGKMVSLSDFKGQKVVVYFYPKDSTPGCTKQACAFRDSYGAFRTAGVNVIGISKDSVASHLKFAEAHGLPFTILADPGMEAINAYGVLKEKKMFGRTVMGVVRTTFVIDEEGMVIKVFEKANPDTNAYDILDFIDGTL
ncbi:MAG: thioredoxin-dependent thiol peroxidase [Christensenellales bacterium]